jgi:hemolysin D
VIARHRLAQAKASVAATEQQRAQAVADFQHARLAELADAEKRASGMEQELVKAEQRLGQQRLTAPVDGVVQQLAVHTVGGIVTPAQPLMVVVPHENRLEIEAMVLNKDIGFVAAGQTAEIKIETFAFTRYGLIDGRVVTVSSDAIQNEKLGLVYATRIAMDRTTMKVEDKSVNLSPGMAATVEIKTGTRRLIE